MSRNEAVVVATARTPIGTAHRGSLAEVDAFRLATTVVRESVGRARVDPALVDDVILGESLYGGGAIARFAAIEAGLVHVPGMAHNRHCASGLATVQTGAASIMAGMDEVVVAGGVQSSSTAPRSTWQGEEDWVAWSHRETPEAPARDMTITVGWNAARKANISRDAMDEWALRSHQRAIAGIDSGAFADEIVPVGDFAVDEHPRRDTTMEKLASLKPVHPEIEGFSITAGNAAGRNDGAAALVLADRTLAEAEGLAALAVIRSWASSGVPPEDTGLAPIDAIPRALARAGIGVADVDLWEINEAFASVPIAAVRALGLDEDRVNVLGSGCSLGHPVAMTGTRMIITLIHELRRRGGGTAVAAMCAGGGMAQAVVFDVGSG